MAALPLNSLPNSKSYRPVRKRNTKKNNNNKTPYNRPTISSIYDMKEEIYSTEKYPFGVFSMEEYPYPYYIDTGNHFAIKKRRFSHYTNQTGKIIRIKFTGKIKNEKQNERNNYFSNKIFKNSKLCEQARDGIYTWISTTKGDIYATETESNQEIGTLHSNLIYFANKSNPEPVKIAVSGEFRITTKNGNTQIEYNFQSGIFFEKILGQLRTKFKKTEKQEKQIKLIQKNLSNAIYKKLKVYCPEWTVEENLNEDFIGNTKFISKTSVINRYINYFNNNIERQNNIGNEFNINAKKSTKINFKSTISLNNNNNISKQSQSSNSKQLLKGGRYKNKTHKKKTNKN
jgi:hypothetical protein